MPHNSSPLAVEAPVRVVLSGRSGSGKSQCLKHLEDLGFYCVDNLPLSLAQALCHEPHLPPRLAISLDARNICVAPEELPNTLKALSSFATHWLYIDAQDDVLLARFHATRRRHPLTSATCTLREALHLETELLAPLLAQRDMLFDTSFWTPYRLAEVLNTVLGHPAAPSLTVQLVSFGFKKGALPEADFVFDARCLPNPFWVPELRPLNGSDPAIQAYFQKHPLVGTFLNDMTTFLKSWLPRFKADNRSYLTVGVGCTGGQHRSVYLAESLSRELSALEHMVIQVRHRDRQHADPQAQQLP